jgi:hypothetical protein
LGGTQNDRPVRCVKVCRALRGRTMVAFHLVGFPVKDRGKFRVAEQNFNAGLKLGNRNPVVLSSHANNRLYQQFRFGAGHRQRRR